MRLFKQLLVLLLVGMSLSTHAVIFRPEVRNFSPKEYGALRNPEVWSVVQGDNGLMYFGSNHGVLEYDGVDWRYIHVKDGQSISALAVGADGKIYVGANNEFGLLQPDQNGNLVYSSLSENLDQSSSFGTVWRIYVTDNFVCFQTEQALFNSTDSGLKIIKPETSFHVSFMLGNDIAVRQRGKGIYLIEENGLEFLVGSEVLAGDGVFGGATSKDGSLFFSQTAGIWHQNQLNEWEQMPNMDFENSLMSGGKIIGCTQLTNGLLALNSLSLGVILLDENGHLKETLTKENGLPSNDIKALTQDRDGNLWLATQNGISMVAYDLPFQLFNASTGLEGNVEAVYEFKESSLYVGTSSGLFMSSIMEEDQMAYHKAVMAGVFTESEHSHETGDFQRVANLSQVWEIVPFRKELFVASSDGISIVHENGEIEPFIARPTNALAFLRPWHAFIGAGPEGIHLYDVHSGKVLAKYEATLPRCSKIVITSLADEMAEVTFGIQGMGVVNVTLFGDMMDVQLDDQDMGLNTQWATPVLSELGVVYCTMDGLVSKGELEVDNGESIPFYNQISLTDKPAPAGPVTDLIADDQGILVVIQNQIYSIDGDGDYSASGFKHLNHGRINFIQRDGLEHLWIGTAEGLLSASITPNSRENGHPALRRITVGEDSTIFNGAGQAASVELPYAEHSLTLDVSFPFYNHGGRIKYAWSISSEKGWSKWSPATSRTFSNLHEGSYVINVKALTAEGIETFPAEYRFTVLPPWYRETWAYVLYLLAFIGFVYAAIKIASYRLKQQNEKLEATVQERTAEIAQKNVVLEKQKSEIFHQKEEITASINYASRIQRAILPEIATFEGGLADFFILYTPRDIVSGDFYWFADTPDGKVIVCADCTGHGVPGAFMSMIGADQLNHTVLKGGITHPSEILAAINRGIKKSLKQTGEEGSTKDGMDAAVIRVNPDTRAVEYAGANRPLWIIRNGELEDIKATKVAVAGFTEDDQVFELQTFELNEGDALYMFSDGYPDQFGGPKGKKFMNKRLKELLKDIYQKPMSEQHDILHQAISDWMGNEEQVDDICVVGVRV